ncbi:MAG: hypothetical protein K5769_08900 [Pseudobutyrivibrio sp.]|nr:hypothetical protein [Pseudobutyrivibrio sp.]
MDLGIIIQLVQNKAKEVSEQEIKRYIKDFPEINLTEEVKNVIETRAISQLTLQLGNFRIIEGQEQDKQFDAWFTSYEEEHLRKTLRHCLNEEANKIRLSSQKNLSSLDAYLKKHLGDIHQID